MTVKKLLHSIEETAAILSVSKRTAEELVGNGTLESVTIGRRRLVPAESLAEYVERLKAAS